MRSLEEAARALAHMAASKPKLERGILAALGAQHAPPWSASTWAADMQAGGRRM